MSKSTIKIRLMQAGDLAAVVGIDEKILKIPRSDYFEMKFEVLFESRDCLPTSLVAEDANGVVVGFVMGTLYMGEFGIYEEQATLDTIGVDPDYRAKGIGEQLINEFVDHLRSLGVKKLSTLVDTEDTKLSRFFAANRFCPSKTINLERRL
jgi:ribosomal protein S18 acetylase RimI-like enzyme